MRMGDDGTGALHGYDGRVIYTDTMTLRLYRLLTDAVRAEVRTMMTTRWSGTRDLGSDDLMDPSGIACATIRISDCVAQCRIEFGAGLRAEERVVIENNEIRTGQEVPDTIVAAMRNRDAGDVFGHRMLQGVRIGGVRQERGPLTLVWSDLTRYIVDGDAYPEDPQLACGAIA